MEDNNNQQELFSKYEDRLLGVKEKLLSRIGEVFLNKIKIKSNSIFFFNEVSDKMLQQFEGKCLEMLDDYSKRIDFLRNEEDSKIKSSINYNSNVTSAYVEESKTSEFGKNNSQKLLSENRTLSDSFKSNGKAKKKKNVNLIKTVPNNSGGMWFHPRELINDEVLVTGGRGGVIKFWDIKNNKFELVAEMDTGVQWITSIKYDSKYSLVYCSTYTEYLFILNYNHANYNITHLKTLKIYGLNSIHGFDLLNFDSVSVLACSGFSENSETVLIYQNEANLNYVLTQAIVPLENVANVVTKKKYSKSIKFCENSNLLVIGLQNGVIEVYILNDVKHAEFSYHINLSIEDWVYQMQIINIDEKNYILASNANLFYCVYFNDVDHKITKKRNFLGSIHDFYHVNTGIGSTSEDKNGELVFIKLKTGLVLVYDLAKDEIVEEIDESKKKGLYDHCLIASKKERLLFSLRDNDILIYKY